MKKIFKYAMMGAIALASFSSCADEEVAEVNPGYNPETGEVPVDFVLSVSMSNAATTRQSAANTQAGATPNFRGMESTYLMSAKLGDSNDGKHMYNVSTDTEADKLYSLGIIITTQDIDPNQTITGAQKSKRVLELSLPINTNCVMFWGKAAKTGSDADQGKVAINVSKKFSETSVSLCPRVPNDDSDPHGQKAFKQYQTLIAAILNKIVGVSTSYTEEKSGTSVSGTLAWSDYAEKDNATNPTKWVKKTYDPSDTEGTEPMCALGEKLAAAFVDLNTFLKDEANNVELRAGSGASVALMLSDLYSVIYPITQATPTNFEERVAQDVAQAIIAEIAKFHNGTAFLSTLNTIKTNSGLEATAINMVTEDLNEFPSKFGMPNGSTLLQYSIADNTYSYRSVVPTYDMGGTSTTNFDIFKYMYPAELCYFGNSGIRVTDDVHTKADYPDGVVDWDTESNWQAGAEGRNNTHDWTTGHVLSSTRSVAMKNNINYGTALLKATVKYKDKILKDNNKAIQKRKIGESSTEDDKSIDVSDATKAFKLKGIIIGGQYQTVGWNYIAKSGSATDCMIYDNKLYKADGSSAQNFTIPSYPTTEGAAATATDPIYTLVWDNYNSSLAADAQNIVYVALEFENQSGENFYGEQNLIRKGETFYITGKLDPNTNTSSITWPEKHALPPYDTEGNTIQTKRVFIQDYVTEANFVIGENSLKKALVALPDLRASQISLGLSVDLNWTTGMTFEDVELGKDTGSSGD